MKAYLYEERRDGKDCTWARFDNNSNERVTFCHEKRGIYQQYWHQREVLYKNQERNIIFIDDYSFELSKNKVGDIINHVWRPGLCLDITALDIDDGEKARARWELKILVERLHDRSENGWFWHVQNARVYGLSIRPDEDTKSTADNHGLCKAKR